MWKPLALAVVLAACPLSLARAEAPMVVVSIKPLHSLAAAVMEGVGSPRLLVSGTASPHSYALKPSEARDIARARLLVWVGPQLEGWLDKQADRHPNALAALEVAGVTRLPPREGGVWDAHDHDHDHGHKDHGDHAERDPHLWLDPANAALIADAIAARLAAADPANAAAYARNGEALKRRLSALDAELRAALSPLAGRSYVVFHDAYHYLEARYGLTPAGSVTVDPDRPPSAKRMAALRERMKASGAACAFREPQFAGPLVQTLADAAGAKVGMLDPEGAAFTPGPGLYEEMMRALAKNLRECLS